MRVAVTTAELPMIAKEVVGAGPNLIVTSGVATTMAILAETRIIPVLFFGVADPIGNGVVDSFARPGGNVTGFASYEPSISGKWLQLLKEIDPRIRRAAMLFNPATTPSRSAPFVDGFRAAAAAFPGGRPSSKPSSATMSASVPCRTPRRRSGRSPDGSTITMRSILTQRSRGAPHGSSSELRPNSQRVR